VHTIGVGDALFSASIHAYARSHDLYEGIHKAILFSSDKIRKKGAAKGFLGQKELEDLYPAYKVVNEK
jgi:ribokinase